MIGNGRSPAAAASSPSAAGSKSGTFLAISARRLSNAPPIASPSKRPPSRSDPPAAAAPAAADAARARRNKRTEKYEEAGAAETEACAFGPGLGKGGGGVEGDSSRIAMDAGRARVELCLACCKSPVERGAPFIGGKEKDKERGE